MFIQITLQYKKGKNKKPLILSISSSEDNKIKVQLLTEPENKLIGNLKARMTKNPLNNFVELDNAMLCCDLTLTQASYILTGNKNGALKRVSLTKANGEALIAYTENDDIKNTTGSLAKMLEDNKDNYKNFLKAYATFTNTPLVTFTPSSENPTFTVSSIPPFESNNNNLSKPTSDEDKYKTSDATTPVVEREKERKIIEEEDFSEKESTKEKNLSDYIVSEDTTSSPKISSTSEQNAAAQAAAKAQLEAIYRDFVLGKFPSNIFKDTHVYVFSVETAANQDDTNTVTAKPKKDNTSVLIEEEPDIEPANVQKDSKTKLNLVSRYYPCDINTRDIYILLTNAGIAPSPKLLLKENSSQGQADSTPDYQQVLLEVQEKIKPLLSKKDVKDIPKVYINAYEKNNYSYKQFLTKLAIDIVEANSNPQTRWHVKHSLFGGNLARFRYDIEEKKPDQERTKKENYIRTVLPRHAYLACKMIAKVGTEYDSQEAVEKIMAMFDREANKPKKSRRQRHQSTQDKYTSYANAEFGGFKKEDPILADHFKFKELINNLKRSIANTEWKVKYTFFGAGTPVEFKYTDETGEIKHFAKRVPAHVGHMCNVFDRIGKNYSYREAVDDIKKILAREVRTDKDRENDVKAIRAGRMELTQQQYDKYMQALEKIPTIKHKMEEHVHGKIWQRFDKPVPTFSR